MKIVSKYSFLGRLTAWLELFRLPNLPTAPGDVIAGFGFIYVAFHALPLVGVAIAAPFCGLLFYMGGLADNDIVGANEDGIIAPYRPIPSGRIRSIAASIARLSCFATAFLIGYVLDLSFLWHCISVMLVLVILAYNRLKKYSPVFGAVLMGLCRGLNLLAGGAAIVSSCDRLLKALSIPFLGWIAYVAALTLIAADEHNSNKPISFIRFIPAAFTLIPLMPVVHYSYSNSAATSLICVLGSFLAAIAWFSSVAPLGIRHNSKVRRIAVGKMITALLYLQGGFAVCTLNSRVIVPFAICVIMRMIIRLFAPRILGS